MRPHDALAFEYKNNQNRWKKKSKSYEVTQNKKTKCAVNYILLIF